MSFAHLFASYWWLIFPIFGMAMGFWGMASGERRNARVFDLIKSYVDQGKEPPPELLKLASQESDYSGYNTPEGRRQGNLWTFVTFAAIAAGFSVGWWFVRGEDFAFAFLIIAVTMGVLALGALLILLRPRK
jgi:hypothetical protein